MKVVRGTVRQDQKGDWWLEVGFGRNMSATVLATEFGGELHVYTGPTSDQTAIGKPPTQGVTAAPIAPPTWAPTTIDQAPPKARVVVLLAADPQFQDWAAGKVGIAPSSIKDASVFALEFVLRETGARVPADFLDEAVIARLDKLYAQFYGRT